MRTILKLVTFNGKCFTITLLHFMRIAEWYRTNSGSCEVKYPHLFCCIGNLRFSFIILWRYAYNAFDDGGKRMKRDNKAEAKVTNGVDFAEQF